MSGSGFTPAAALVQILRGGYCTRWHANPDLAHIRETLAEHHGRVVQILLALHPDASARLLAAAVHHDCGEPLVGDLPAPFKAGWPDIARAHAEAEGEMLAELGVHVEMDAQDTGWLKLADALAAILHVAMVRPDLLERREPHDSLDDFPTPPWATRALCEWIWLRTYSWGAEAHPMSLMTCREPAANRGHMVKPLREFFGAVEASDIHDYGAGFPVQDYLFGPAPAEVDWTITNPPFRLAEQFIWRGISTSRQGVAVIVRSAFLEGVRRWNDLFAYHPPSDVLQFSERVVMHKGKLSAKGSTATAYSWLVWRKGAGGTAFDWIKPCRKIYERPEDYA